MERMLGRFIPRGPPNVPVRGVQHPTSALGTSPGSAATPKTSTTEKGRVPAQTAKGNTKSSAKK